MTTGEMRRVLEAFEDGQGIQLRPKDGFLLDWVDEARPVWDFYRYDYRVKVAPREGWVNICDIWEAGSATIKKGNYIKMREVVD